MFPDGVLNVYFNQLQVPMQILHVQILTKNYLTKNAKIFLFSDKRLKRNKLCWIWPEASDKEMRIHTFEKSLRGEHQTKSVTSFYLRYAKFSIFFN